jgi:hypothetical protein
MESEQLIKKMQEEEYAKVMAMPVVGTGRFCWCGKLHILPIIKLGKRDVTLRSEDGTRITFNKKYVEVL